MAPTAVEAETASKEPVVDAEVQEGAQGGKRKRATKLEVAQKEVKECEDRMDKLREKILKLAQSGSTKPATLKKAEAEKAKLDLLEPVYQAALAKLEEQKTLAAAAAAKAQAKQVEAKAKEEKNRNMSDAFAMEMVKLRIKYQSRFDNTSDSGAAIWEKIKGELDVRVDNGEFASSDKRGVPALQARWNLELGAFRLWASKANRAVVAAGVATQSGAAPPARRALDRATLLLSTAL